MQDLATFAVFTLIPTAVVFVIALLGNLISFDNRLINALATAAVSAAVVIGIAAYTTREMPFKSYVVLALAGGGVAFLADVIANRIAFTGRFVNALVTAAVFGVPFAGLIYYMVVLAGLVS
jgi:hypothetical protein